LRKEERGKRREEKDEDEDEDEDEDRGRGQGKRRLDEVKCFSICLGIKN